MNLEKLRVAVNKLNMLLNNPTMTSDFFQMAGAESDVGSDFNQQLDQLLTEFDAARRPQSVRFMRSSHRPAER